MSAEPIEPGEAPHSAAGEDPKAGCGPGWNDENKSAIADDNQRIASEGLPLARYRGFARES